jgi:hypothetical protein
MSPSFVEIVAVYCRFGSMVIAGGFGHDFCGPAPPATGAGLADGLADGLASELAGLAAAVGARAAVGCVDEPPPEAHAAPNNALRKDNIRTLLTLAVPL